MYMYISLIAVDHLSLESIPCGRVTLSITIVQYIKLDIEAKMIVMLMNKKRLRITNNGVGLYL